MLRVLELASRPSQAPGDKAERSAAAGSAPSGVGGGGDISSRERYVRGKVLGSDPHAGGRAVLEVFGPQETDGDDAISGLWRFFNELDVTWPVQAVLSS